MPEPANAACKASELDPPSRNIAYSKLRHAVWWSEHWLKLRCGLPRNGKCCQLRGYGRQCEIQQDLTCLNGISATFVLSIVPKLTSVDSSGPAKRGAAMPMSRATESSRSEAEDSASNEGSTSRSLRMWLWSCSNVLSIDTGFLVPTLGKTATSACVRKWCAT